MNIFINKIQEHLRSESASLWAAKNFLSKAFSGFSIFFQSHSRAVPVSLSLQRHRNGFFTETFFPLEFWQLILHFLGPPKAIKLSSILQSESVVSPIIAVIPLISHPKNIILIDEINTSLIKSLLVWLKSY